MKALIIYDSFFGNTEKVARAIGDALAGRGEVEVARVSEVKAGQLAGLDLLVVGSPTRGFRPTPAITEFLKSLAPDALKGVCVAAFDTRIPQSEIDSAVFFLRYMVRLFGYAAAPIARLLQGHGGRLAIPAEGFFVHGREGPLLEGELQRAGEWANFPL
jgi:flavodoxin